MIRRIVFLAACAGAAAGLGCSSKGSSGPGGPVDAAADATTDAAQASDAAQAMDAAADAGAWRTDVVDQDLPVPLAEGGAPTPPMGWNSWNHFFCNVNAQAVRSAADAIVNTGMQDAGYQYVNIDDCWQLVDRTDAGAVQPDPVAFPNPDPVAFPNGIAAVADYVHSKGLKLGIYSDRGTNTCQGRAGSQGFEAQDALAYASWGVDYLKYDNCYVTLDMQTQYQTMQAALAATNRPFVFSICSWQFDEWELGTGQLWRTGMDIQATWSPMAGTSGATAGSVITSLKYNANLAAYAGPNGWNDPDMLEVDNGMSFLEDESHFTMWAMMAAPLLAGNDLTNLDTGTRNILLNTDVISLDQDALGLQGTPVRIDGDLVNTDSEVWAKPLNASGTRAVVLLNAGTSSQDISFKFTEVGLSPGPAQIRDLWKHTDLGSFTDSYTASGIPSHGVVALKLTGATEPAIPIGTAWLSDVTWTYVANGLGPVEKDSSVGASKAGDGKTLTLQGTTYAKGLGVAGPSAVIYRLGKVCTNFSADIGIDDETKGKGSVVFHVFVDGVEKFNSNTVIATTAVQHVSVDLTGASRMRLLVTDANDGSSNDHADWAGAQLTCP
jgi:alpha-galactosidase